VPQVLVTDGASAFVSEEFQALCKMLRMANKTSLPHHPQAHGIVERQHQEIVAMAMIVFIDIDAAAAETWPKLLPAVQGALNTRTHLATEYTPHHLGAQGARHCAAPGGASWTFIR